ncbi:MAG: hypothetical protein K1X53_05760 [Candidatus Sumerlaeaceae bacterium]|nr:hypothetical protein [Candidatus Sumerlaeaceae bacterium]
MLIVLLLSAGQGGCTREDAAPQGVTMQLTPSKTAYRLNENIVIAVKLTNPGSKPCQIIPDLETIVQIVDMSRDGMPIEPSYTVRTHFIESERFVHDKLIQLEPHSSREFSWQSVPWTSTGAGVAFLASPLGTENPRVIARWSIDESGDYKLTARNLLPTFMRLLPDACAAPTDSLTITFTVIQK